MDLDDEKDNVTQNMYILGGVSLFCFLLTLSSINNIVTVASPVKAYTVLLQATNATILPIGVALVVASLFVADTVATAEAPTTAFAMFILGVFVILLSVLGCVGASLHSRGIVKLFLLLVLALGLLFIAFGIAALVQADRVEQYISDNWEDIRQVLPPTFSGRHDQEQFEQFVSANLRAFGYIAMVTGFLLFSQAYSSKKLRYELKREQAEESKATKGDLFRFENDRPNIFRVLWKQYWTAGTKTHKRIIGCCCCCVALVVAVVIALSTMVLIFSTSCESLGEYSSRYERVLNSSTSALHYRNRFTRGTLDVNVHDDPEQAKVIFDVEIGAFRRGMGADEEEVEYDPESGTHGLTMNDAAPTKVLGFDISCQSADTTMHLPVSSVYGGNSFSHSLNTPSLNTTAKGRRAGVTLDMRSVSFKDRPRFRHINAETEGGVFELLGILTGSDGIQGKTKGGPILLEKVDVACDPDKLGEDFANVRLETETGITSLEDSDFLDCDIHITTDLSTISLRRISSSGDGTFHGDSFRGGIDITDCRIDSYELNTDKGVIRGRDVRAEDAIRVSTNSGLLDFKDIIMGERGVVQIESEVGDVELRFKRFKGIVSIASEGNIECSGEGFDEDGEEKCPVSSRDGDMKNVDQVNANCEETNDCPYSGEITVVTRRGNVKIHIEKWDNL